VLFDKLAAQKKAGFFLQFSYFLIFLNIQIDLIILKTYNQQFTLTTKKSLYIIFKYVYRPVCLHCKYIDDLYEVQLNQFPVHTGQKCIHN